MGINRTEKTLLVTCGPFQWVRHPIYLFQVVMLAGTGLLLPTPISLSILVIHMVCLVVKASDEEDIPMEGTRGRVWQLRLAHWKVPP